MLDFRKALLALSVAGLGLVGTASAQVMTCQGVTAIPNGPGYVALESTTASLPQLSIACTGGQTVTGSMTVLLTANVPFTNVTAPNSTSLDVTASDGNNNDTVSSVTQLGPTVIQIVFQTITGTPASLTVSGLRVNASLAPASSAITVGASGVSGGGFSDSTAPATVAYVVKSLAVPTLSNVANSSACNVAANTAPPVTAVTVQEGFLSAFQTATDITNGGAVAASQGTRLAVTFTNLNAGVNYYVPANVTNGTLTLIAYSAATGSGTPTAATTPAVVAGQVLLTVTGGSATVYYGVTADNPAAVENATIQLVENIPSVSSITSYSKVPVGVSITLVGPSSGYPQYSTSQTAYTATQSTQQGTNGLLQACTTTLLFPYVVNVDGFDTGIAITNASTGGVSSAISPTSGACAVTFYGTGTPTTNPYNTGTVNTGTVVPFDLGTVAPGFSGYAVAVCNFQGAQGYAFLSTGFGTNAGLAADYLATTVAQ